jgi:hypothetical protein
MHGAGTECHLIPQSTSQQFQLHGTQTKGILNPACSLRLNQAKWKERYIVVVVVAAGVGEGIAQHECVPFVLPVECWSCAAAAFVCL